MKVIDGSVLEGGGQILRNVLSLSCLFKTSVQINNIRAGRDKPGLRPQHACGVNLVVDISSGSCEGGSVGSTTLLFYPGENLKTKENAVFDTKTAGSISLLIQTALPCLLFSSAHSDIEFIGGTNADFSPPIDFMSTVLKAYALRFGAEFDIHLRKRGYYPRGGGKVLLSVKPLRHLKSIELTDQGKVVRVFGRSWVAGKVPRKIGHITRDYALKSLNASEIFKKATLNVEMCSDSPQVAPMGSANGIELFAETSTGCILSSSLLGSKDYMPEQLGKDAVKRLVANVINGECVDEYMQDQIVLFMALAQGTSKVRTGPPTLHTRTAIHMAEQMTDSKIKFKHEAINDNQGHGYLLEVTGVGLQNQNL